VDSEHKGQKYMSEIKIKLYVEPGDSLFLKDDKIYVVKDKKKHIYKVSSIQTILIVTTDQGPFLADTVMAIALDNYTVIFMMSEHECYAPFLFDQIGKVLTIDYQKAIEAASCTENNTFVIYSREY